MDKQKIKEILTAHGFVTQDETGDLKDYVYVAADALLAAGHAEFIARSVDGMKAIAFDRPGTLDHVAFNAAVREVCAYPLATAPRSPYITVNHRRKSDVAPELASYFVNRSYPADPKLGLFIIANQMPPCGLRDLLTRAREQLVNPNANTRRESDLASYI